MEPTPDKGILKKIKDYDEYLDVVWDKDRKRWAIKRFDPSQKKEYHIFYVHDEKGNFRQLDDRVLDEIYESDIWKHFKSGADYHKFIQDKNNKVAQKAKDVRKDYLRWWNKEHKREWKSAIENAHNGILSIPTEREKKLYSLPS